MKPAYAVALSLTAIAFLLGYSVASSKVSDIRGDMRSFSTLKEKYQDQLGRVALLEAQGADYNMVNDAQYVCYRYASDYNDDALGVPKWHFQIARLPDNLDRSDCGWIIG